ncbi:uncharacterized protein [Spinacia oleracea]|uniref:RNase H type-1 domain-containing protein n=1 Tax=Spinacia oleracea TaxID=3562 RepID=A0A9R0ISM6_SPIOL|nr:uncharacterized protein LOC110793955 [Spinacia oleracea]
MLEIEDCPWCPGVSETMHHALFACQAVRDLWRECDCEDLVCEDENADFKDILEKWQKLDASVRKRGAALLWWTWNRRNDKVFNNKDIPHLLVRERVNRLVEEQGKYSNRIYNRISNTSPISPRTWKPPPSGFVKVNCDASLSEQGWIGLGATARDSQGAIIFAGTRRVRGRWPPEIAECKAILFAVKLAKRYGLNKVIVESDNQSIISRLTKWTTYFSDLDGVLDDILFLSSSFEFVAWSHVKRDGNFVAHHLARLLPFGIEQVWEYSYPVNISPYVLMDSLAID